MYYLVFGMKLVSYTNSESFDENMKRCINESLDRLITGHFSFSLSKASLNYCTCNQRVLLDASDAVGSGHLPSYR